MNKRIRISDVCDVFDGPHATPQKTECGPIYLGIDAISEDCRLNPSEYAHLSEQDFKIWTKRVTPQADDIVFSYEATLGRYALIPEGFYGCLGRRLAIIRTKDKKINPRWLFYYFLSPEWTDFIKNQKIKGSTVDRISVEDYPSYSIPDIERSEQDKISKLLTSIDKKIDCNIKICNELQSMSKVLFNYWFAQFEFPDKNGKPYKSSGGKMVWNELLKREIPDGWAVNSFLDVIDWVGTSQPPKSSFVHEPQAGYIRFVQNRDYDGDKHITYIPLTPTTRTCDEKDIMIDKYGDAGRTRFGIAGAYNVALSKIVVHDRKMKEYIRAYLESDSIYEYLHSACIASTRASLNEDNFSFLSIVIPDDSVLEEFDSVMCNIIKERLNINSENSKLVELRDFLLPMLMNGQVKIKE